MPSRGVDMGHFGAHRKADAYVGLGNRMIVGVRLAHVRVPPHGPVRAAG
jgi:hypothetical protein